MKLVLKILVLQMLVLGASVARADSADDLVKQLGSPDPNLRGEAYKKLQSMNENARDALKKGSESSQPQVAESCTTLLARLPWTIESDPPEAITILSGYGTSPEEDRVAKIQTLLNRNDPRLDEVALRILSEEPSDDVIWDSVGYASRSPAWQKLLKSKPVKTLKPQLIFSLAMTYIGFDRAEWSRLMRLFLECEIDHPTAHQEVIQFVIKALSNRSRAPLQKSELLPYYRHLVSISQDENQIEKSVNELLAIQVRFGPFPGIAEDIRKYADKSRFHMLAIAHLAGKSGANLPAMIFREQAGNLIVDPNDPEELEEMTEFAIMVGELEYAKVGLFKIADVEITSADQQKLALDANLRLASIFRSQSDHLQTARRLEKAVSLVNDELSLQIPFDNLGFRIYPVDKMKDVINWEYYKNAIDTEDSKTALHLATELARGSSDDETIYLDIIDNIQPILPPDLFNQYADRVYKALLYQWTQQQNDPNTSNELAWLCARSNIHLNEAIPLAQFAVEKEPDNSAYLDTLAEVHYRLGEPQKSVELEEKALLITPGDEFMIKQLERFKAATTQPVK